MMTQENQGTSSPVPENMPVKRKRGRPRKDRNQIHGAKVSATPTPDTEKRTQRRKIDSATNTENGMVGKVVSGVLDGSFEAGYLLTVRVGDTDTILKGVVFRPGLSVPVSGANDVAPHVKMLKRAEIHIPVDLPSQMHGSTGQAIQKSERPVEPPWKSGGFLQPMASPPVNQVPKVTPQSSPSQIQIRKGVENDTKHVSQAAFNAIQRAEENDPLPKDRAGLLPAGHDITKQVTVVTPLHVPQSELKNEPAFATQRSSEYVETAKKVMLPETETPSISEAPGDGDASNGIKLDLKIELSKNLLLEQLPQSEDQPAASELKPDKPIDSALEFQNPIAAAVNEATRPFNEAVKLSHENQNFRNDLLKEMLQREGIQAVPYNLDAGLATKHSGDVPQPPLSCSTIPTGNEVHVSKDTIRVDPEAIRRD